MQGVREVRDLKKALNKSLEFLTSNGREIKTQQSCHLEEQETSDFFNITRKG